MALGVRQHLGPRYGDEPQRNIISHCPRRHENGRFVAQNGGNLFLEGPHCRVFAPMVVPDLRVINGAAHSLVGLSHGVTAEIDR